MRIRFLFLSLALAAGHLLVAADSPKLRTENVILVSFDGLRWQEVFGGADPALLTRANVAHYDDARKLFWRENAEERRAALLPFLWDVVARHGQLFGNTNKGSIVRLTNTKKFSYPGYQEMLGGFADERINSNGAGPNTNVTVLEWLHGKRRFRDHVAAFASWNVFHDIIHTKRAGLFVTAGTEPVVYKSMSQRQELLNKISRDTLPPWDTVRWDFLTYQIAAEYVQSRKPRVLYVAFDETDDYAHDGHYERVLRSAHQTDHFIRLLWEQVQSIPQYRGKTTLLITTDHGRGDAAGGAWRDHGGKTVGSEYIWLAALGPDTAALGERVNCAPVTLSQVAATLAALLKEDYSAAEPRAGRAINDVIGLK